MKQRALEFVNSKVEELNGLAPSRLTVVDWLTEFANDEVKAINYTQCCKSDSEPLKCDCGETEDVKIIPICKDCYNNGEW